MIYSWERESMVGHAEWGCMKVQLESLSPSISLSNSELRWALIKSVTKMLLSSTEKDWYLEEHGCPHKRIKKYRFTLIQLGQWFSTLGNLLLQSWCVSFSWELLCAKGCLIDAWTVLLRLYYCPLWTSKKIYYCIFLCMNVWPCVYMCTMYMPGIPRGQKRASVLPEQNCELPYWYWEH